MILRRLSQSLKEQNWTAILIEFILLVAGVFLGIQVSNWNAARADDVRAQTYLLRIKDNLNYDLQAIERREVFWRQVIDYGNSAIRYAETGELVDGSKGKTVLAFYQASQLWPWLTNDTTYQELSNGGELGLIKDGNFRESLTKYYAEGAGKDLDYILSSQPEYRKIVRGLTPVAVSNHVWAKCWKLPNAYEQYLLDCESPISEADAQKVLDAYLKHPELLSELRFWNSSQGIAVKLVVNNKVAVTDMLKQMEKAAAK
jgi:hypothetical protein